jgi:hypothetical protein
VGVGIGPPKVLGWPKPVSSVMMITTFGAPFGGLIGCGKEGLDSRIVRPMTPLKSGAAGGSRAGDSAAPTAVGWPNGAAAARQTPSKAAAVSALELGNVLVMRISVFNQCDSPKMNEDALRRVPTLRYRDASHFVSQSNAACRCSAVTLCPVSGATMIFSFSVASAAR